MTTPTRPRGIYAPDEHTRQGEDYQPMHPTETYDALTGDAFNHIPSCARGEAAAAFAAEAQTHHCLAHWSGAATPSTDELGSLRSRIEHGPTCPHRAAVGQVESFDNWQRRWLEEWDAQTQASAHAESIEGIPSQVFVEAAQAHLRTHERADASDELAAAVRAYLLEAARTGAPVEAYCSSRAWNLWVHGSRIEVGDFVARYADAATRPLLEQLVALSRQHGGMSAQIGPIGNEQWRMSLYGLDTRSAAYEAEEHTCAEAYARAVKRALEILARNHAS